MTGGAPPPPLTEQGVRLAWADMAVHWAEPARRLVESHRFLDVQLGFLALHMCVVRASMLVNGHTDRITGVRIPPDTLAVAECPIEARRLRSLSERTARIRDQIMHLADGLEAGRVVSLDAKRGRLAIAVVGKGGRTERMTDARRLASLRRWNLGFRSTGTG